MQLTSLLGDADALFNVTELSGSLGLIATVILTINMVLGMMLSTSFKNTNWVIKLPAKIKAVDVNNLHNYTAYVALFFVFAHVLLIPFDAANKFTFLDILWPVNAPHQPNIVLLGTFSLLALLTVIITTQKGAIKMIYILIAPFLIIGIYFPSILNLLYNMLIFSGYKCSVLGFWNIFVM